MFSASLGGDDYRAKYPYTGGWSSDFARTWEVSPQPIRATQFDRDHYDVLNSLFLTLNCSRAETMRDCVRDILNGYLCVCVCVVRGSNRYERTQAAPNLTTCSSCEVHTRIPEEMRGLGLSTKMVWRLLVLES